MRLRKKCAQLGARSALPAPLNSFFDVCAYALLVFAGGLGLLARCYPGLTDGAPFGYTCAQTLCIARPDFR